MVISHTGRVIDSHHDLVMSLVLLRSPHPDLVLPKLTGDVGNHFAHVQTLPSAIITSDINKIKNIVNK